VALGRLDALMPQQLRDFFQGNAIFQKVHSERVPQPVADHAAGSRDLRVSKERAEILLPISSG